MTMQRKRDIDIAGFTCCTGTKCRLEYCDAFERNISPSIFLLFARYTSSSITFFCREQPSFAVNKQPTFCSFPVVSSVPLLPSQIASSHLFISACPSLLRQTSVCRSFGKPPSIRRPFFPLCRSPLLFRWFMLEPRVPQRIKSKTLFARVFEIF